MKTIPYQQPISTLKSTAGEAAPGERQATLALRDEMVLIGRLLFERGLIVGIDGNLSARIGKDRLLCTPGGAIKGLLRPEDLLEVDLDGRPTSGGRPSSELALHLTAYRLRPDIRAIVHAHPPAVIALSIAGLGLLPEILPEAILVCGLPATVPYAPPSSLEGAKAAEAALAVADTLVLSRHGSLALGADLRQAYARTESLEQLARTAAWLHSCLGPLALELGLSLTEARRLIAIRRELGLGAPHDQERFEAHWANL